MPYITFSTPVNASLSTAWDVVIDKIENPKRYNPAASDPQILERYSDGVMRQMKALNMTVKEKIVIDQKNRQIRHFLVDNPLFTGKTVNSVVVPASDNPDAPLLISYTMDWEPINEEARKLEKEIQDKLEHAVQHAVISAKTVAEQREKESLSRSTSMLEYFPGTTTELVLRLFSRGEAFDSEGFVTFFTDKPVYQFSNFDVCLDKDAILKSSKDFFSKITAVYHEIKMIWEVGNLVFVEMDVAYWRKDGSMISLPCSDIFRVEGDKFSELRIFMDVMPVFDPKIPVPSSASVLTVSEGKKMMPPNTMRKFFAEHPEAIQRAKQGYVPKWSIAGPKWSINGSKSSGSLLEKVEKMVDALTAEKWEEFQTYLAKDVFYKVGAEAPVKGPQAASDYLYNFYQIVKPTKHDIRGTWEKDNTVIVEMDANYRRISDGKKITLPCTDVYRFDGDLITEWRVYPDMSPVTA